MKYTVLKDTREQNGWTFYSSDNCKGTVDYKLPTGDYTIQGFETTLSIERKGTTGEFARNIIEQRFVNELERMRSFKHSFVVLEFNVDDVINFPKGSGIPVSEWSKLKINPWFILKRLMEFELQYPTKIIFAGNRGKEVTASIFKRIVELYGEQLYEKQAEKTKRRVRKKAC